MFTAGSQDQRRRLGSQQDLAHQPMRLPQKLFNYFSKMTEDENEFIQFTNTNRKIAQKYLKLSKSNVQQAIDIYYNDNPDGTLHKATSGGSINKKSSKNVKKNILFEEYGVDGMIDVDGTQKMLADLGIEPNDPVFIAISYYFDSPSMCEFSVDGFNKGCQKFGISSLDTFKKALGTIA